PRRGGRSGRSGRAPGRCVGICEGLGRGPPSEAGLGRGGIADGLGRGPLWLMPNGLLPPLRGGRGPDGRPPPGACGAPGRPAAGEPGRGGTIPGPGLGRLAGAAGSATGRWRACWAALTAASWSALSAAARASAAATSMSWALAGLITGAAGGGAGAFFAGGVTLLGGAGLADTRGPPAPAAAAGAVGGDEGADAEAEPASKATRNRRATGASTVLDADLTNSPISFSLASTVLLSTPSSFASSCTRALPATALLIPRPRGQVPASTSLPHLKPGH
ncbi:MAG: hypothetical protein V7603_1148, partial [Micromonosporaceae bacterium]